MHIKLKESMKTVLPTIALLLLSCIASGQTQPATIEQVTEHPQAVEIQQPSQVEPQRIDLGRIGVVVAGFKPAVSFDKPMNTRDAAGRGALVGAGSWIAAGSRSGGYGFIAGLALSPVAAVVGSIIGAIKGESEEKIKETEDTLIGYFGTLDPQEALRDQLLSVCREQTPYTFIPLPDLKGPSFPNEEVTYDVSSHQDIDTVLEIGVQRFRLSGDTSNINPDLQLSVDGSIRFLSAKDGKVLHILWVSYDGDTHKFLDWGTDNAQPFKEGIERALQSLARQIIDEASSLQRHPDTKPSEKMETK